MFDPLHKWFGIPPSEQPPDDYRLLGIAKFEDDLDVIDAAADKQLAYLHDLTNGDYGDLAEELSNRVSAARLRLLNAEKKAAYDEQLLDEESEFSDDFESGTPIGFAPPAPQAVPPVAQGSVSTPPVGAAPVTPAPVRPAAVAPTPASPATLAQRPTKPAVRVRQKRQRKSSESRSSGAYRIWLYAITPGLIFLAVLLGLIVTGRIKLDANKLEDWGVSPETAAKFGEKPQEIVIVETRPGNPNPSPSPSSNDSSVSRSPGSHVSPNNSNSQTVASSNSRKAWPSSSGASTSPPSSASGGNSKPPRGPAMTGGEPPKSANLADLLRDPMKFPIPLPELLTSKMEIVRDLYETQFEAAKTSSQKSKLATQIQAEAEKTRDDPAGRYALSMVAKNIFLAAGDFESAFGVVDDVNETFSGVDAFDQKIEIVNKIGNVPSSRSGLFTANVLDLIDQGLSESRLEEVEGLITTFRGSGTRMSPTQSSELKLLEKQLAEGKKLMSEYEEAAAVLEGDPSNTAAKTAVGKYLCFVEKRWPDGLPYLAECDNPSIAAAAVAELEQQTSLGGGLKVADAWYASIESIKDPIEKQEAAERAQHWYTEAKDYASGLEIRKIETRLAELKKRMEPMEAAKSMVRRPKRTPRRRPVGPRVLNTQTWHSTQSATDSASVNKGVITVSMGNNPTGYGEAAAGIEFEGVTLIRVAGVSSHSSTPRVDSSTKIGFMVDFHTDRGYSKRVFLSCNRTYTYSLFNNNPPWGSSTQPDEKMNVGDKSPYLFDLTRWAPEDWDGNCWFSVYMHNGGVGHSLVATLQWQGPTN